MSHNQILYREEPHPSTTLARVCHRNSVAYKMDQNQAMSLSGSAVANPKWSHVLQSNVGCAEEISRKWPGIVEQLVILALRRLKL